MIASHTTVSSASSLLKRCRIAHILADLVNGANIDQTVSVNGKVVSTLSWRTYVLLELRQMGTDSSSQTASGKGAGWGTGKLALGHL